MKNLKFLFLSLFLVAFLAPNAVNAQASIRVPGTIALTIEDPKLGHIVEYNAGRVVITPSGNLQLKASFDVSGYPNLLVVPEKGKKKITVYRVAVRVLPKNSADFTYHFEERNVDVIVDSNGMASVVLNWQVGEDMGD